MFPKEGKYVCNSCGATKDIGGKAEVIVTDSRDRMMKVIDEDELSNEHIHIGSKVELRVTNKQTGKSDVVMYQIVGSNEADPLEGLISDESAVGRALLDHSTGDRFDVEVPVGVMEYEVLAISK